jgi:hypothetical protein
MGCVLFAPVAQHKRADRDIVDAAWYQIREREDDEIIEALNRYTLKLQTSLKVVNSTDM